MEGFKFIKEMIKFLEVQTGGVILEMKIYAIN